MKKRMKSLVALGLSVGLLAGCGSEPTTSVSEVKESSSEVKESSSEVVESKYPEYLNLDSFRPIVKEGEKITLTMTMGTTSATTSEPEGRWFYHFMEEVLNIDLEVDQNYNEERKSIMLNSNDLPDMVFDAAMTPTDLVVYGQDGGLFLDISEYISEELTPNIVKAMEEYPEIFEACVTPDGKMYTVPTIDYNQYGKGSSQGQSRMFLDTAYMEAAGIKEVPKTLDELLDMLRAFKKLDPATMGVDEIIPWCANWHYDWYYLYNVFGWVSSDVGSFTVPAWDVEEKKVVVPCLTEEFADYVKLLHTMYSEDLVHDDYFTISKDTVRALSAEGKVGLVSDSLISASQPERVEEFVAVPPVTSDWCSVPVASAPVGYSYGNVVISADTKYPELCVRFLDYLYSDEGSVYTAKGPVQGSEDELGMIQGFTAKPNTNVVTYPAVLSGEYTADYNYNRACVALTGGMNLYSAKSTDLMQTMAGLEPTSSYDKSNYEGLITYEAQYPYLVKILNDPYTTPEQAEKLTDLSTVMQNYVAAEVAKFVVGQRPIEELDAFIEEIWALDGQEYLDLCQQVYKR